MNKLVSICCITYNHENYIERCIEGILAQRTDFDIELLIFDDASVDNTQMILRKYSSNKKVTLFLQTENQWSNRKYGFKDFLFPHASSKYIAICEGDDFWIDSYKLQKQVDFLEKNSDYALCFHLVKIFNESNLRYETDNITRPVNKSTSLKDLALGNYIHTPSVVFRNKDINLPEWFSNVPIGDYPLWCIIALSGNLYKMEEEMAVYRIHDKSLMKNILDGELKTKIKVNDGMLPFYEYMYEKSEIANFRKTLIGLLIANQSYAIRDCNYKLAKKYSIIILGKHIFQLSLKQLASTILAFIFPQTLRKYYGK